MVVHTLNPNILEVEAEGQEFKVLLSYTANLKPASVLSEKNKAGASNVVQSRKPGDPHSIPSIHIKVGEIPPNYLDLHTCTVSSVHTCTVSSVHTRT